MLRLILILLAAPLALFAQGTRPHAHNDYLHARPLEDALSHGFGSVEADVFLENGELVVAHTKGEIKAERTLEKLYLAPLKAKADANGGRVTTNFASLILLIDFKTEAAGTWKALEPLLRKYEGMLTKFEGTNAAVRAVSVILSGNRPTNELAGASERWAAIDGRLADLGANPKQSLYPLISDNWGTHFRWRGGAMADEEKKKLAEIVAQAKAQRRLLRFWATPDNAEAWGMLADAGVNLINTDKLGELAEFLKGRAKR